MSAALVLPYVWAIGARLPIAPQPTQPPPDLHRPRVDFYRKYTEALLRRYIRVSMEAGKVPSLIGQEMFREKVTNYRVGNFVDAVIFVHDVDRCLQRLDEEQGTLIAHLALQQYTLLETAKLMGIARSSVIRKYGYALDRLTRIFLDAEMLEPLQTCQ